MMSASYDFYLVPVEQYVGGIMARLCLETRISRFKVTSWEHFILLIHVVFWEKCAKRARKSRTRALARLERQAVTLRCKCQTCACPNKIPTIDYKVLKIQKTRSHSSGRTARVLMLIELSTLRSLVSLSTSVGQKRDWNVDHCSISDSSLLFACLC